MLSAHGSAPRWSTAPGRRPGGGRRRLPLVTKVHHELKVRARKGYTVLYVGHHGHEEAVGTMAVAPERCACSKRVEDVDALDLRAGAGDADPRWWPCWPRPRSATTNGPASWTGPGERFPDLWMPNRSDLCFATTNRQAALKALAGRSTRW